MRFPLYLSSKSSARGRPPSANLRWWPRAASYLWTPLWQVDRDGVGDLLVEVRHVVCRLDRTEDRELQSVRLAVPREVSDRLVRHRGRDLDVDFGRVISLVD